MGPHPPGRLGRTRTRAVVLGLAVVLGTAGCGDAGGDEASPASDEASAGSAEHRPLQAVVEAVLSGDEAQRAAAARLLPSYGAEAVAALGARLRIAWDEDEIRTITQTLLSLGPRAQAAIPDLVAALGGADRNGQYAAQEAIAEFGEPGARALVCEIDAEPHRAILAAITLSRFPTLPDICVPALLRALDNPDEHVRYVAAHSLKTFKEKAAPATPRLVELLEDERVMWTASECLSEIGASAVPALTDAIDSGGTWSKVFGAQALARIGAPARAAVPALLRRMSDPLSGVRGSALEALASILPAADAVPLLVAALHEEHSPGLQGIAAESLRALGPAAAGAIPDLRAAMRTGDWYARLRAAHAVLVIDPADTEGVGILAAALGSDSGFDHGEAARRLEGLDSRATAAVPALEAYVAAGGEGLFLDDARRALAAIRLRTEAR